MVDSIHEMVQIQILYSHSTPINFTTFYCMTMLTNLTLVPPSVISRANMSNTVIWRNTASDVSDLSQ